MKLATYLVFWYLTQTPYLWALAGFLIPVPQVRLLSGAPMNPMPKKEPVLTFANRLHQEVFIAGEYRKLILRQPGKFIRFTVRDYLFWITRLAPALRPVHLVCRMIDDIADGDRKLPPEFSSFPQLIEIAQKQIETGVVSFQSNALILLQNAISAAERRQIKPGEVQASFTEFLEVMLLEFRRRTERRLLDQQELIDLHIASSFHAHNIGLICFGSHSRASDTPEFSELIGRMDALRDMTKELRLGTVNIPREVMTQAGCSYEDVVNAPQSVYSHPEIVNWMRDELCYGETLIDELAQRKVDRTAKMILKIRLRSTIRSVKELGQLHLPRMGRLLSLS